MKPTMQSRVMLSILFLCLQVSPLMFTELTVGTHRIKIIPESYGRLFQPLSFKFTINWILPVYMEPVEFIMSCGAWNL